MVDIIKFLKTILFIVIFVTVFTILISLTSCSDSRSIDHGPTEKQFDYEYFVVTDPDTGVQYLGFSYANSRGGYLGLVPRYNPDGTLVIAN